MSAVGESRRLYRTVIPAAATCDNRFALTASETGGKGRAALPWRRRSRSFSSGSTTRTRTAALPTVRRPSLLRRSARQVDDPRRSRKRPAIIDPHDDPPPGVERRHLDIAGQGQGGVRRRRPAGAEAFAVRGALARFAAIPAGIAEHVIGRVLGGHIGDAAHRIGLADPDRIVADRPVIPARTGGEQGRRRRGPSAHRFPNHDARLGRAARAIKRFAPRLAA